MKKTLLLFALAAVIIFSCKKEKIEPVPSSDNAFLTFSIPGQLSSVVNPGAHTVVITMPFGVKLDTLVAASFTFSPSAVVKINAIEQTSGVTLNNFVTSITYTITAENGTSVQNWIITANYETYSIIKEDFPLAGETFYMNIDSTNLGGYSLGVAVKGGIWNFTNLGIDNIDTIDFMDPSSYPGSANFPGSNVVIRNHSDQFDMFGTVATDIAEVIGMYGTTTGMLISAPMSNHSTYLKFPSEYGVNFQDDGILQKDTSIIYSGFPVPVSFHVDINTESEIDANGLINTPIGSFKCVREHNVQIIHTQVLVAGAPYFNQIDTIRAYNYFNKEKGYPVLIVEVDAAGNILRIKHQE